MRLFTVCLPDRALDIASPQPEDAMNETACLLLIGGAALVMASTLLRLPVRVRVAVIAAVLMALSLAGIDPIAVSPEFAIASLS
jgi:hypothetical protein